MSDIADMILVGILDEQTGEYIGEAVGYPRTAQPGFYNSMGRKKTYNNQKAKPKKHKKLNLGGTHLIGRNVITEKYGKCIILDYVGKRGQKSYIISDSEKNKHKVKFSSMTLIK